MDRAVLTALLSVLGCDGGADGKPDPTGDADTDADSDADTDTDTDTDADTDTDTDTEPLPVDDGYAVLVHLRSSDAPPEAYFLAQFYDVVTAPTSGVAFRQPPGPDQCGLTLYTTVDLQDGTAGEYAYQGAGALDLTGPGLALHLTADLVQDQLYDADVDPATFPFGGAVDVAVAGDAFPAFSLPGAIQVPPDWTLQAPVGGFHLDGALEVAWTASDPEPLLLSVNVSNVAGARGLVRCELVNDGAFTVPAALVDQLPGGYASVHVERAVSSVLDVDGRPVTFTGAVTAIVAGTRP